MANLSIYQNLLGPVKSVADYDAEYAKGQANAFALQEAENKQNLFNRDQADESAIRDAYRSANGDTKAVLTNLASRGLYKQHGAISKSLLDAEKTRGDIAKDAAETDSKKWGVVTGKVKMLGQSMTYLMQNPTVENAQRVLQENLQNGTLGQEQYQAMLTELQKDSNPDSIRRGAEIMVRNATDAEKQLPTMSTVNAGGYQIGYATDPVNMQRKEIGRDFVTETEAQRLARERQAADAKASRDQSAYQFSERQKQSADQFNTTQANKPAGGKTGPMSVTLQKELLESDDTVQSAKNVVGILENAKKINKDAYSGYFAKGRATLASNMPGKTPGADATIDIDNMMTGQALESLKTIFGGMPTEGERKILLEMQASVDKTPEQREAIMDRAMAAAKRRGEYAGTKAKSIRDGSYLSQGMPEIAPTESPKPGKTIVRTGTLNGRKVNQYSDGTTDYAN